MHSKFLHYIISLVFSLFLLTPGFAKSNDPYGDMYISKDWGDISNCGPIAALMVSKFVQEKTPETSLRSNIRKVRQSVQKDIESTRWWKMSDIKSYFSLRKIKYTSERIVKEDKFASSNITDHIDKNDVVVINVNMNDLSMGRKIGKPYFTFPIPGGWGHYLVIVGYKYIDDQLVFEVHDSFTKKGKNRAFYAKNIMSAIKGYNPEIVVAHQTNNKFDNLMAKEKARKRLVNAKPLNKNIVSVELKDFELVADKK